MFLLCFLSALELFVTPNVDKALPPVFERKTLTGLFPSLVIPVLSKGQEQLQKALPWALSLHGWQIPLWGSVAISACALYLPSHCLEEDHFFQRPDHFKTCQGSTPQVLLTVPVVLLLFCYNNAGWILCPNTVLIPIYRKDQINQYRLNFILGNSWR